MGNAKTKEKVKFLVYKVAVFVKKFKWWSKLACKQTKLNSG